VGFFFADKGPKSGRVSTTEPARSASKQVSRQLSLLSSSSLSCNNCSLNKAALVHPKMLPTGSKNPLVYMLGEAPGQQEDEDGEQFVGRAGQTLRERIPEEWEGHIRWNNTLRCRPPGNRDPLPLETACCRHLQEDDIAKSKPLAVFGFGNVPLEWMIGERGIHQWRGRRIPCKIKGHSFWFYPMLHPSYINRIRNDRKKGEEWERVFTADLERALSDVEIGKEEPYVEDFKKDLLKGIAPLLSWRVEDVRQALHSLLGEQDIGLDIETKGLKPQAAGAKILSIAVGTYDKICTFPLDHRQAKWSKEQRIEIDKLLLDFLLKSGTKWCQNAKFEQEWLSFFYGNDILFQTQWGDTMAQAHVLDEREGKALEDLTIIHFGFNLKKCHSVDVKNLDNEPLEDVLWYNGTDAKYTHPIALLQQERLEEQGLLPVYEMTNRRCPALVLTQRRGLHVNQTEVQDWNKKLRKDIEKTEEKIRALPDVQDWEKEKGAKFRPSSTQDLANLLHNHLHLPDGSTDETVLEQLKHPIGKLELQYRADTTLLTRYVTPYMPGGKHIFPDGMVYGNFSHLVTRTGRLASDDPNLQNWPKRKRKELRNIICVPEGEWMVAADYGQIEARVIGMASRDLGLCKQLWTDFDIHAHWTRRILEEYPKWRGHIIQEFELSKHDEKLIFKTCRNETKNGWVFAQFYGSSYEACAAGMGIPSDVARGLSKEFWADYVGAKRWQDKLRTFYIENGYVETLTGRRRRAPLSINERANSPIQGTASDIVVDAMERLSVIAYEQERPQLQPILNVHDDLTFRLPDKTLEEDIEVIAREMLMCRYNFINVPLIIDVSVGKSWGALEEIQVFRSTDYDEWNKLFGHCKVV
jgi:uracil-DNA glycosylase family 4